ncbi:MAG: hypothetical protein ABJG68_05815 [Crocinitomicaceae bacterium]
MKTFALILGLLLTTVTFSQDLKKADKLFKAEQYAEALVIYKKHLDIDPTDMNAGYKYGACVVMLNKDNDKAIEMLTIAEKSGKSDKEIAFFMGRAYENKEDYAKALEYYERFSVAAEKEQLKKLKVKARIKACKKALK